MLAVLFDVDLTLVDAKRAGSRAMKVVFERLWGLEDALATVPMAGRTDHGILGEVLTGALGRDPTDVELAERQAAFLVGYLDRLELELELTPAEPCPGVLPLLARLAEVTPLAPGLATGNFEGGALRKLGSAGIDAARFAYGAFGDDHADRADVVGLAAERAGRHAGRDVRAVVVGDTPRDLAAARENSLSCALVATGPYSRADLEPLEPDLMLDDLTDADRFLEWLSMLSA